MKIETYLEKAEQIIIEEGVEWLSMDRLAAKIGSTKRSIYNNFESKDDLFHSIIDYRKEMIKNETLPFFSEYGTDALKIFDKWLTYYNCYLEKIYSRMIPSIKKRYPHYYNYILDSINQNFHEYLALLIPRGRDEGLFLRNFNTDIFAQHVFTTLFGYRELMPTVTGRKLPSSTPLPYGIEDIVKFLCHSVCSEAGFKRLLIFREN